MTKIDEAELEAPLPCPFCAKELEVREGGHVWSYQHPIGGLCPGANVIIEIWPEPNHAALARWNRRALSATQEPLPQASEAVAWEIYRPGAGSVSSTTTLTRIKAGADRAALTGAQVTPLYASPPSRSSIRAEALKEVEAERERQKAVEGWSEEHDDTHTLGEMALAAASYALSAAFPADVTIHRIPTDRLAAAVWPWDYHYWFKDAGPARRKLVKAAALIVAEIERLDRRALANPKEKA